MRPALVVLAVVTFGCTGMIGEPMIGEPVGRPDGADVDGGSVVADAGSPGTEPDGGAQPVPTAIADLQPGQWLEIPNSKLRSVAQDPNDTLFHNIVAAWSGGAVDTKRSRLLIWGGGHQDYHGNDMYALDLPSMSVKRILDKTPASSGDPTSRHTYDGSTYIEHVDRFFSVGGALVSGDVDFATWTYDFTIARWFKNIDRSPTAVGSYGYMARYDPVSRLVYVNDTNSILTYNFETNSYTRVATSYARNYTTMTIDTKRRKLVIIGSDEGVRVVDMVTNRRTVLNTINPPDLIHRGAPGAAYDPIADRIVCWSGGDQVYALNMDTNEWSQVATNPGPASFTPPSTGGTFGRWGYVPKLRVFALINSVDENAWVFRLAN